MSAQKNQSRGSKRTGPKPPGRQGRGAEVLRRPPAIAAGPGSGEVQVERVYPRFTLAQRWEHGLLILTFLVLLLTGLPQKYFELWGHYVLTNPASIFLVRRIHHIAAIALILEAVYHLGHAVWLMARRRQPAFIFPTWKDVTDAWQMVKYLLFIDRRKPAFGKYNFEQKFTYWFVFFGIAVMILTGLTLWFPIAITYVLPGGVIPAAYRAHSSEAIAATIFILLWHFYHVHFERLNLSIFTGRLNERDMQTYHPMEYERLTGERAPEPAAGQPAKGERV